jgi:hypothetical protein
MELDQKVLDARSVLLKEMPTLDDTNVIVRQDGDMSRGVQIRNTDATGGQDDVGTTSGSGKGKERAVVAGFATKVGSQS